MKTLIGNARHGRLLSKWRVLQKREWKRWKKTWKIFEKDWIDRLPNDCRKIRLVVCVFSSSVAMHTMNEQLSVYLIVLAVPNHWKLLIHNHYLSPLSMMTHQPLLHRCKKADWLVNNKGSYLVLNSSTSLLLLGLMLVLVVISCLSSHRHFHQDSSNLVDPLSLNQGGLVSSHHSSSRNKWSQPIRNRYLPFLWGTGLHKLSSQLQVEEGSHCSLLTSHTVLTWEVEMFHGHNSSLGIFSSNIQWSSHLAGELVWCVYECLLSMCSLFIRVHPMTVDQGHTIAHPRMDVPVRW